MYLFEIVVQISDSSLLFSGIPSPPLLVRGAKKGVYATYNTSTPWEKTLTQAVRLHPDSIPEFPESAVGTKCRQKDYWSKSYAARAPASSPDPTGPPHPPTLRKSGSSDANSSLILLRANTSRSLSNTETIFYFPNPTN